MMRRLHDYFILLWYRLTYCRRHGHTYNLMYSDYCKICGGGGPR